MASSNGLGIVWPRGVRRKIAKGRLYLYDGEGGPLLWSGPLAEVEPRAAEILELLANRHRPVEGSVKRLIDDYERSLEFRRLATQTQDLYGQFLREARKRLGDLDLRQFAGKGGRDRIRAWRIEAAERSLRTADQIKTVVGALATWGRRQDMLPSDAKPTADMPRLYVAPPQPAWSDAEIAVAVFSLPARLSAAVRLAVDTGLRREDLVRLTWASIDDARGVIRWRPSKGRRYGREAIIDLTPSLRATLRGCPDNADTVLTNTLGKPWTADGLHNSLTAALAPLGIDKGLHGLRRAAASRLSAQGMSNGQIARRLGWSEAEVARMLAVYIDPMVEADNRADNRRQPLSAPSAYVLDNAGAGKGNRTPVTSLEGQRRPLRAFGACGASRWKLSRRR